jgi:hypothetical protein
MCMDMLEEAMKNDEYKGESGPEEPYCVCMDENHEQAECDGK